MEPISPREALQPYLKPDTTKVIVRFKSVGSAPIMKQNYYKITGSHPFSAVHTFLRKELGWGKPGGTSATGGELFLYINSAFAPAPDDTVSNLYKSFQTDGQLIVNYSTTPAWG
ncbi:hypothetical protein FFLO_00498 [Filobasidium floriforme]|uniref:Ubiquitin-like protein ATG12 n=1 Tax=Filobasidium floriforme TaxID=5210 RepID=A0A8K0NTN1_9TREE|nr:ubiquitin-like protein Atg12 [Filobasidium floriforme]KAG7571482.1 hypothetical protein FFLO_00498 [Filobasidium floriforme]KAH8088102.1 ubiquitin-like protein Atg12 [Filobasidium floriforme]